MKKKVEPLAASLDQIISGLNVFNLVSHMRKEQEAFELVFCDSDALKWTYDHFIKSLKVIWAEEGSNRKKQQLQIYRTFIEMLEVCFNDSELEYVLF